MFKTIDPIKITPRGEIGKGVARKLRKDGVLPSVLYGLGGNIPVNVKTSDLQEITSYADVFQVDLDGKVKLVHIKELQLHPVSRQPLHCDLLEIEENIPLEVAIPLRLKGKSEGVAQGGVLNTLIREIPTKCLPRDIPESFDLDITSLDINQSLTIADLSKEAKVDFLLPEKTVLVRVVEKIIVEEEVKETAEEGAEEGDKEASTEEASDKDKEKANESSKKN